jgi:endo-1,4-beta-xylanase
MVAITYLTAALAAVTGALASPVQVEAEQPTVVLNERGVPNFIFDDNHPLTIARRAANVTGILARSNTNYNQNYHTGGTVNFSPSTNKFTLNYNVQQDFVVGVGWNPGSTA